MKNNNQSKIKGIVVLLGLTFSLIMPSFAQNNGNGNGNGKGNNPKDSTTTSAVAPMMVIDPGGGGTTYPPATPSTPTASTNYCGAKTLYRGTPPSGVVWNWQTTANGTDDNGAPTYSANASGTYYLRAYSISDDLWSTNSASITVSVNPSPGAPSVPTVQNSCSSSVFTRGTPPSGITWYWQGTNSSGTSTSNSSLTYSVSNSSTYYIRSRNNSTGCWGGSQAVSGSPIAGPDAPPGPSASTNTCGNKILTRVGDPPHASGIYWYWQGKNSNGTSTGSMGTSYTATSSGTYYIRAYAVEDGCWSTSSSVTVTVNPYPSTPSTPTSSTNTCGNKTLTRGNPPSGYTWYWHTSPTGTSTTQSGINYSVSSSGTYYLRAQNNTTGCWSTSSSSVSVTVNAYPSTPAAPTKSTNTCGNVTLSRSNPPSGTTWYWHTSATGTSTTYSGTSYTATSSGTYYLRARTGAGCWSTNSSSITVTVNPIPTTPPQPSASTNTCDDKTLTRGTPPSGITWYWQGTDPYGTSTSNSSLNYNVSSSGVYYLRAQNNTTGCWSSTSVSKTVLVNPLPGTPETPTASTNTCGDKILSVGTPPSGITWFWQGTNSSGTGISYSGTTYPAQVAGTHTYYLRAQNNSTGCWSASSASISVTVNQYPNDPNLPTVSTNTCGEKTLTQGTAPAGVTWYWQGKLSTGTSTVNSSPTYTAGSSGTYYLRAKSDAGCWSNSVSVDVIVNDIPVAPVMPTIVSSYGKTTLSHENPPFGFTYYWHTVPNDTDESNSKLAYETTSNTIVYLAAKSTAGCWSPDQTINVTVTPVPSIQVTGNHLLAPGCTSATLTCIGTYDTYEWKKDGVAVGSGISYIVTTPGNYTVTVTKTGINDSYTTRSETFSQYTAGQAMNSTTVTSVLAEGITSEASIDALTVGQRNIATSYIGGLGNPLQTVAWDASPNLKDIVSTIEYDAFGRQTRSYLPYEASTGTGGYRPHALEGCDYTNSEQYAFYQQTSNKVATDTRPYSETTFEASPSSRALTSTGPGNDWAANNKNVSGDYTFNQAGENIRVWTLNATTGLPESLTTYGANQLMVSISTDEHGDQVKTYTDKLGRQILKSVQSGVSTWRLTYQVYDRLNRLRYTLPPEMVAEMVTANNFVPVVGKVDKWAFQYKYDEYGRTVETRTPGTKGWTYAVYDKLHRPVMTQDPNLRANNQWAFVKYDILGRPVVTGIKTITGNRATIQGYVDAQAYLYELANTTATGYTLNRTYPTATDTELQSVVYYDNYGFLSYSGWDAEAHNFGFVNEMQYTGYETRVKGKVTGSKLKIHGQTTWLNSVVYYSDKLQPIQTITENHLSDTERATLVYDFSGKLVQTRYQKNGSDVFRIWQDYFYDHIGRLVKVTHQINDQPKVILSASEYNPLGQLIDKQLHSEDSGLSYAQSVDYRYNIRGWLTAINDAGLSDGEGDLWGMELAYNTSLGTGNAAQYTGLISAAKWSHNLEGEQEAYNYSYDKLNRLTTADHKEKTVNWINTNAFDVNGLSYDNNGNITKLNRKDKSGSPMDVLSYIYDATYGNQLVGMNDAGNTEGFANNNAGTDYTYDDNGNLIVDNNKGISSITYTELNKPETITYTSGKTVTYLYNTAGTKLRTTVTDGGNTVTTDYVGPAVYVNGTMEYIQTAGGRLVPGPLTGAPSASTPWTYEYYLTDQLGNVRTVFTTKPTTDVYTATMETENVGNGVEELFTQLNETRAVSTAANHTAGGNEAAQLDDTKPVGPGIIIPVFPGDSLNLEVWGYYEGGSGYNTATPAGMAAGIASAFGGVSGGAGEAGAIYNGLSSALAALGFGGTTDDTRPAAYLNYIVLDENYNYQADNPSGFQQMPANASFSQQQMTLPGIKINKVGYIFVYVSYESQVHNRVYFDDLKVTYHQGRVEQYNDYYPFGMQAASSWTRSTVRKNNRLFNAASEYNEATGLYDTDFRSYDAALGRFTGVDMMAANFSNYSPYNFAYNNPVSMNDPTGLYPTGIDPFEAPEGPGVNAFPNMFGGPMGPGNDYWTDNFSRPYRDYFVMSGSNFERKWGVSTFDFSQLMETGNFIEVNGVWKYQRMEKTGKYLAGGMPETGTLMYYDVYEPVTLGVLHENKNYNKFKEESLLEKLLSYFDNELVIYGDGNETESVFGNKHQRGRKVFGWESGETIILFNSIAKDFYKFFKNILNSSNRGNPMNNDPNEQIYETAQKLSEMIDEVTEKPLYSPGDTLFSPKESRYYIYKDAMTNAWLARPPKNTNVPAVPKY